MLPEQFPTPQPVPLEAREVDTISALIFYAARKWTVKEEIVRELVMEKFGVSDVSELLSPHFEDVIKFVVELAETKQDRLIN